MPEIRKDGTRILAEDSVFPLRNEKGDVIGFRGISRDITERKRAEEALRQSEERYRTILEEMEDAYFEVDLGGHLTFVNNSVCRDLGYSWEELIGMSYKSFTAEEDIESVFQVFNDVYRTGAPNKGFPWKVIRKDGTPGFAEASVSILRDDKGEIIGFRGVGRDITERKKADEVLKAEKNKLQSVIDAMRDDLTIQDMEYNIIFQNEPAIRSTGGDRTGKKCYRVYEGREGICEDCPVEKAFKDGKPHTSVRQQLLPSGDLSFWENTANPIMDAEGRVVSCLEIGRNITERKKAQEALDIQRAYFQQLFDTSPDAIIMMDTDDRAIQVNKGFEKLFGYSNEEVKGRSLTELIVPQEDAQEASKSLEKILAGETIRKERIRRRKDGSLADVSVLAYPICSNGKVIGAYGIYTDITERRRQEQTLADELTRRRLLIDQSLDGIVVLDVDARVIEANQRFAEMLGYTMEEVRELRTWDWDKNFPPEKILEMGRDVDEKGFRLETKHTRKDGSIIDVDISINGATCTGQKLIFCVCRDVTTRKKMSEGLELAAKEWRNTFDSISDAVSIQDRDFRIQRANKGFADLFGKSFGEIIGTHCYELHNRNEPRSGCPQQCMLTSGNPATLEFYDQHLGKYLVESTSPILNERGETVGAVRITRDITEQKRQNERLIMTDRLASIGELASGTAHELNNPLTSIIGFSQLIMEREIPDDIREDLKLINTEAQRAANVTKNLLTFARKHAPVKQLSEINNIIEDVLKLRAYEHKVNNITVVKQLHPNLPQMMVDYFQMQQVFMNIIINAEYFMTAAHKRGTMSITTKKQNGTVRISIADDGPGIPPENLRRIFDPFFTTKEVGRGTGLGLSICHGIVTEHGGQIYVKSQLGKGATIHVELPINGVQTV
jgi:PAS domain S-box-containing protein